MALEIRQARASDAERLSELAMSAKASWGYPAEWLESWREELVLTPAYVESHWALAAEIDGEVVGVCVLEDRGETWAIEHLWVDPDLQGRGVGRALVFEALARAGSVRPGAVRVLSDSFAEPFYRRLGARKVEDVPAPMPGAPERVLPLLEFLV